VPKSRRQFLFSSDDQWLQWIWEGIVGIEAMSMFDVRSAFFKMKPGFECNPGTDLSRFLRLEFNGPDQRFSHFVEPEVDIVVPKYKHNFVTGVDKSG
jgi:hypothetical protein